MKARIPATVSAMTMMVVLLVPAVTSGQHKHQKARQNKSGMPGMKSEMAKMMQSPHHQLMMAHMKSMSEFAVTLRDQAVKPKALDVDFARAAVAELRHNLDAMEAIHQKHMQTMSAEMQSKMQMMMEKMDKDRSMLKDRVSALETDVQADKPDPKQVSTDTNALLKHLGMMSKMHGESKPGKKKMEMKM